MIKKYGKIEKNQKRNSLNIVEKVIFRALKEMKLIKIFVQIQQKIK